MKHYALPVISSLSVALCCLPGVASAQPSGMEVVSGSADLASPQSHLLQIQASDRAIIQWDSFSIGSGEMTRFVLPDAASAVLNRVSGSQMSELMGVLQSNGQIFLINPQGVFVGPDATINTASFIASTFDVLNEDFLAKANLLFQGDSTASIVNLGTISTQMGDVILLARYIDNQGSIEAPQGTAALGAGTRVLLKPADSTKIYIETSIATGAQEGVGIHNQGSIQALLVELQADGNPYQHAIRHDGRLDALGVAERNGRILLIADEGQVYITGHSKATAAEQIAPDAGVEAYGEITVCADDIVVTDQASFDVSNELGGGLIRLGFERQEDGPRARGLWTGKEVQFNADAIANGNGGRVLLWGGDAHVFLSNITARGGAVSGDGGFVEISTRGSLIPEGLVNTLAVNGKTGTLLLDPTNITITTAGNGTLDFTTIGLTTFVRATMGQSSTQNINNTTLIGYLNMNNVDISTASAGSQAGDITIGTGAAPPVSIAWTASTTLKLFANQNILIQGQVAATMGGAIDFTANGNITFTSSTAGGAASLTTDSGNITLLAGGNITMLPAAASTTGNLIQTTSSGNILLTTANLNPTGASLISLSVVGGGATSFSRITTLMSGNITIVASGGSTGALTLTAGATAAGQAAEIVAASTGNVTITTGLPVDVLGFGAGTPGSVTLSPGGAAAGQNAQITAADGTLTLNMLQGNLTINGGTAQIVNPIFGRVAKTGSMAANGMSVFVDGNITIGTAMVPTGGNYVDNGTGVAGPFGVYMTTPNSVFNLTVSRDVSTVMGTGSILMGTAFPGLGISSVTTISILGNLMMTSAFPVAIVTAPTANIRNLISGSNGMTLSVGGDALLTTAGGTAAAAETYTQIGAKNAAPLNVTIGGNLSLLNTTALVRAGETQILSESTQGATVIVNGSITITGSPSTDPGGGTSGLGVSFLGCSTGPLVVTCAEDIVMTAGKFQADALIGYPYVGPTMGVAFNYPITVNTNNLIMIAGAGTPNLWVPISVIGTGAWNNSNSRSGDITVNATGTVSMFGGITPGMHPAAAIIGHVGTGGATLTGNIVVHALNVHMQGNVALLNSFAQIGHTTVNTAITVNPYTLTVIADRNIVMTSATGAMATAPSTGNAQIWNRSTSPPANAITVICDNASQTAPDYGTGFFSFGTGSIIYAGAGSAPMLGAGEVRIYTSVRIFNTVTTMGPGQYASLPINGSSPGVFPAPLGITMSNNEKWGAWANPAVSGGGADYPVGTSFVIYYKRVGGVLISNLPTSNATVGLDTTFTQTESYIPAAAIQTALGGGSVGINVETLPTAMPLTAVPTNNILNGNSILWRTVPAIAGNANITWGNSNSLTLTAGNDVAVKDATIIATGGTAVDRINVFAGRDCVIGTRDQVSGFPASLEVTMPAVGRINIVTGRDLLIGGSGLFLGALGQIVNIAGTGNVLTIGRDVAMRANQAATQLRMNSATATIGRNLIQNGGNILDAFSAFILGSVGASGPSTVSVGGYHSLNGGSGDAAYAQFDFLQPAASSQTLTYTSNSGLYLTGGSGRSAGANTLGGGSALFTLSGPSTATAHITVTNGNVILNGGAGGGAYIQVRHLGIVNPGIPLTLNVPNGSLIIQGNQLGSSNNAAPIAPTYNYGAAAIFTTTNSTSPITITVGGDVRLIGGNGPGTFATIGNPLVTGTTGAITINVAGNLIQQGGGTAVIPSLSLGAGAGTGPNTVAQIFTGATGLQPVTLQVGGDYLVTGGPGFASSAGVLSQNAQTGAFSATVGGDMILTGGAHTNAIAACSWNRSTAGTTSTITVGNATVGTGDLILRSGTGYGASAFLSLPNAAAQNQNITCAGNLVLTSDASAPGFSFAGITGGAAVIHSLSIGGNVTITANGNNPAFVGSGNPALTGSYTGTITFNSIGGDLMLNGSTLLGVTPPPNTAFPLPNFTRGFAQIGHVNGATVAGTIAGDITIMATGSVIQNGGRNPGGYAQIGHGGYAKTAGTDTYSPCIVKVSAGRNIVMYTSISMSVVSPGPAQTVNYATGTGSSITLVTDNNYATSPESGPGFFYFSLDSQILTGFNGTVNPDTQVRIYTSSRIFNTVIGPINGMSLPITTLDVTNPLEQWGFYAPTGTYPSMAPFQFYYKRIGGLVISPNRGGDNGVMYDDGVYTFFLAEAIINSLNLSSNLATVSNNVLIDSSGLDASPLGSSANSILIESSNPLVPNPIGWGNTNTLTINSSQDLVLNNTIASSSTGFSTDSSGITLNAARNIFIGDGTEVVPTGISSASAPINVTASSGSIGLYGGAAPSAAVLLSNLGPSNTHLMASNGGVTLRGGGVDSTSVLITQNVGDIIIDVLEGDFNMRGGSAHNTFAEMNIPSTLQNGNVVVTVSTGNAYMVGGSGNTSYSGIFNSSSGVNGGSVRFSVLQGNFVAQAGSENPSLVGLQSTSPGVLHVDVAGDLTMKGFGDAVSFTATGEGICNVGGNLLMRAGSIFTNLSSPSVVQLAGNPLTVTVGGGITMIAQNNNYVLIANITFPFDSDITVTACAGISLQGEISGQQSDTLGYAKIGHFTDTGGIFPLAGDINVTAGDAVTLKAGSFNGTRLAGTVPPSQSVAPIIPTASAAQIGLGRNVTGGPALTASGATTINARALTIQAGLGAQGGSASVFSSGLPSLTLNLSAGDLYIQSGGSTGSSATAIAREGSTMIPGGSVTATVSNGNILLLAGVGSGASVDIPNTAALTNGSGTTSVTCAGSLTITGGLGSNSNASIGIVSLDEALTVNVGSDVIMTSGFGANSYANIGCITPMMMTTSPITLTAGGNVLLTAAGYGYAKIGHGFVTVTTPLPSWSATISVTAGGDIVLSGTGGSNLGTTGGVPIAGGGLGFSQIGHTNSQSVVTSILGDIQVTAGGSLLLNPGLKSTAYARIGHGGVAKLPGVISTDVYTGGTIHVLCGENVYMLNSDSLRLAQAGNAVVWGQLAQIVNLCLSPSVDSIWIVTDQNHPTLPDAGTGHFVFSSNAFVASQPPMASAQRVKIYTAVRVFNFLPAGSQVNGLPPYTVTSLPMSIPASAGGEAWGYSYATDATNPITIGLNYEIYYKRVGGITLSGDATTAGVTLGGGTYIFSGIAEAVINTTTLTVLPPSLPTALMADATVNAANLEGTSDPNNSILFRRTWNTGVMDPRMDQSTLFWLNATQLTLSAPQDIAIDASMSALGGGLAAIVLTAGRDVLVETCGLFGNITSIFSAPITITAGQDYRSKGPSLGFTNNAQIAAIGSGAVAVTAGRDVAMTGGAYVGTALQYPPALGESQSIETSTGSITVTATTGSVFMRGGYGSPAGLVSGDAPIAVHAAQDIAMQGGSGGLHSFVEIRNGAIITPNAIVMTAGGNIYMLGGLGLAPAPSDVGVRVQSLSGGISITAGGSIAMTASPSISSLPILPIDTTQSPGVVIAVFGAQPIVIRSGGDFTMTSSPGGSEAGVWSFGGLSTLIDLSIGGNLTINSANLPLALLLLNQNLAVAHIGGNGPATGPTVLIRNVNGNLTLNGNRNSYATIGGNSANASQTYTGNITIQNVDGYVTLNAYNGSCNDDYGFVQIGVPNNRTSSASTIDSTVTIAAQQDITLNGGSTRSAFARIGNGGQEKTSGVDVMSGDVSLFSGYGNLTLNSNTGGAAIAAFTNMAAAGSITTIIAGNTTLNGSSTITTQTGPITLLTGVSQILNDSSSISNVSPSGISIVADNLYPTPPDFGLGRILTAFNSSISTPGPLRLYSAAQQINIVSGLINSQRFTPGPLNINSAVEQWFKYYPQFFGGFPYIFFYKTSLQGMILDATVANSTLTQFLPLAVPIIRVETRPVDETKESEET